MRRDGLFAEMFTRRLALLTALSGLAIVPVVVRLVHLTVKRGAELRREAEAKLVVQRWEPTTRGRIVDRKGRVLAQDRPSYDVAVEYPVITGQWVYERAGEEARKAAGSDWRKLAPVQREARIQELAPKYRRHLEDAWKRFADLGGISVEELTERRNAIIADVSRQSTSIWEADRQELEDQINGDYEFTEDGAYRGVSVSEVAEPIREQRTPHVLLHEVDDATAMKFPLAAAGLQGVVGARVKGSGEMWMPGLHLIDGSGREYPLANVQVTIEKGTFPGPLKSDGQMIFNVADPMAQIVGWMRTRPLDQDYWWRDQVTSGSETDRRRTAGEEELKAWEVGKREDRRSGLVRAADPMGYFGNDSVGAVGVEWAMEQVLRGRRGSVIEKIDTGEKSVTPREAGRDVQLTIDAVLQARLQALMSPEAGLAVVQPWQKNRALPEGTVLSGAAVVIDVQTGDILAMVSTPTFTRTQVQQFPESVFGDEKEMPALSKAFARPYPPGSIVKPLMYCAAVTEGVFDAMKRIDCTGHLYPDQPNLFRCWIYKNAPHTTHTIQLGGPLEVTSAIMASCNIFFYSVGRALGPERIGKWYERFGVGENAEQARLGLGAQFSGTAGRLGAGGVEHRVSEDDEAEMGSGTVVRKGVVARGVSLSESTLMGIGQGPIAWTPLHAADAYATLARGGVRVLPRLRTSEAMVTENLQLDQRAVSLALEGLRRSVSEDRGTGHHITIEATGVRENTFNVPGVTVWGKSGTADSGVMARNAAGQMILDEAGRPVSLDHAWFVVLAGPAGGQPKYAVSLLVERGGSGGRVSGPVCNQILHALVAEGYLP